jgi:hypothetical protein
MQQRSKLSKTKSWTPQTARNKSSFFAQLFSANGPSNLHRKSPSTPAAVPNVPTNLAIQSLSPDLLNDPAFSSDPLSNPDTPLTSLQTSQNSPRKNLIILQPPRIMSPPPAYEDRTSPRLAATASNSTLRRNNSRYRDLDPIDELDESNPLGLSLHHGGPYEAIKKLSQQQVHLAFHSFIFSSHLLQMNYNQPRQHSPARKKTPSTLPPAAAVPVVPFGVSLNLTPGQILPRNFQPYIQPLRQSPSQPYRQQNSPDRPIQQESDTQPFPQRNQSQSPSQLQPALPPPSSSTEDTRSIYEDEAEAYGGIEEEKPVNSSPETVVHPQEIPSTSRFDTAHVPQTHNDGVTAICGDDDDAVARALYAVAVERTRMQRAQGPDRFRNVAASSGFSAFDNTPSATAYQPPSVHPTSIPYGRPREGPPYPNNAHVQQYAPRSSPPWQHHHGPPVDAVSQRPRQRVTDPGRQLPGPQNQNSVQSMHPTMPTMESYPQQPQRIPEGPVHHRPAPSIQQSVSSTNSRNGPLPRHIPSKLTMPQPLYNPSTAPNFNLTPEPSRSRFQPPQHGTGMGQSSVQPRGSSATNPSKMQAQVIPMATDSRKVLRKRASVQGPSELGKSAAAPVPASGVPEMTHLPDWLAPQSKLPPKRSKSEMKPMVQKDKKAPRRLLSKKRAEF